LVSTPDPHERRQASSPLRVLIADDDRDTVVTLSALLQAEGYHVLEVYRGDAVLELVRRYPYPPHAVLLDIGMPGLTGFQIARRLRDELGQACPLLVAITAWGQAAAREMGRLSGFHHYLVKPYESQELLALLQPLASS
jgi:DNA-binding response OmpR family regulator